MLHYQPNLAFWSFPWHTPLHWAELKPVTWKLESWPRLLVRTDSRDGFPYQRTAQARKKKKMVRKNLHYSVYNIFKSYICLPTICIKIGSSRLVVTTFPINSVIIIQKIQMHKHPNHGGRLATNWMFEDTKAINPDFCGKKMMCKTFVLKYFNPWKTHLAYLQTLGLEATSVI